MIKQRDTAALLRGFTAIFAFGGLPAVMGGMGGYELLHHELLKHGYVLPDKTGVQFGIDMMGLGGTGLENVDILSLRDPMGLGMYSVSSAFGPAIGSVADVLGPRGTFWTGMNEDNYRKSMQGLLPMLIGPQAMAAAQAGRELWNHGQVFGPSGELEAIRPFLASFVRGVDWAPSTRSEVWKYSRDMADAIESGNADTIQRIATDAQSKGIVLGPQFEARVRSILAKRKKTGGLWPF